MPIEPNEDNTDGWICWCGNYEESDFHCSSCGAPPPWGCDCSFCDVENDEEEPFEDDEEFIL